MTDCEMLPEFPEEPTVAVPADLFAFFVNLAHNDLWDHYTTYDTIADAEEVGFKILFEQVPEWLAQLPGCAACREEDHEGQLDRFGQPKTEAQDPAEDVEGDRSARKVSLLLVEAARYKTTGEPPPDVLGLPFTLDDLHEQVRTIKQQGFEEWIAFLTNEADEGQVPEVMTELRWLWSGAIRGPNGES